MNTLPIRADSSANSFRVPERGVQMCSTMGSDGAIRLELAEVPVRLPKPGQVVVRMEAAPINPSDVMAMCGAADLRDAQPLTDATFPGVQIPLTPAARRRMRTREGAVLAVGQEGAGRVVKTADDTADWLGRRVAVMPAAGGTFSHYLTIATRECLPVPDHVGAAAAAALFVNPMTALAMVETVRLDGHAALVHTAAASALGQMLVRICRADGISLINIVRRQEHVQTLRSLGADHVCDSSASSFSDDLAAALETTRATVAFDAIGGGTMAGDLLAAMESAAAARASHPGPYGSFEHKQVYLYGHLDPSPTVLDVPANGLLWAVSGWMMPQTLSRLSTERLSALRQRIVDQYDTTFTTEFSRHVPFEQTLTTEEIRGYGRHATGEKHLITFDPQPLGSHYEEVRHDR